MRPYSSTQKGSLAFANREADLVNDVEIEIRDIGNDKWGLVCLLQDRRDQGIAGDVVKCPRCVLNGQIDGVRLARGFNNAARKRRIGRRIGDKYLLTIGHSESPEPFGQYSAVKLLGPARTRRSSLSSVRSNHRPAKSLRIYEHAS